MGIFDFLKKKSDNKTNTKINRKKAVNKPKQAELKYFRDVYIRCLYKYDFSIDELARFYSSNICINCGCLLNLNVINSRNCPECNNKIIIKTDMYSKRKLMLNQEMLRTFNKYDKEIRDILYMERLMKKKESLYINYLDLFKKIKENTQSSPRDIMWQFLNQVAANLDNKAYKKYMYAMKLNQQDRTLESFDAILNFKKANQEYATMHKICMYEEKYNVAISSLADIIYRDIQIAILDVESNPYHKTKVDDFVNAAIIRVPDINDLINKSDYSLNDFKNVFLNQRHPFILPKISNDVAWKYVEMAIKKYENSKN